MEITQDQIDKNREKLRKEIVHGERNPINLDELLREDEDENTVAKSIVDEIIEETETPTISSRAEL